MATAAPGTLPSPVYHPTPDSLYNEGARSQRLLVLEARAANRVRLAEGDRGALRLRLDEEGDQEAALRGCNA